MIYPIMVTAALLCVWGTAAYMSVCGLVAVFGGHAVVTALLAAGMELGKLLAILHLHRNWRTIGNGPRCFYALVISALVMVTSIEAAGYLIQSHNQASAGVSAARSEMDGLESYEQALRHRIAVIDDTLAQLPGGHVSRRISERAAAGYDGLQGELMANLTRQQALGVELSRGSAQAGPVFAFAEMAGLDSGRALLSFVVLLVCIMEPLSIGLAVAASMAWMRLRCSSGEHGVSLASDTLAVEAASIAVVTAEETAKGTAETAKTATVTAETAKESGYSAVPENIAFLDIVRRHNLKTADIATITGRKKYETVVSWLKGDQAIPEKALRELRRWSDAQPAIRLVGR